jgi:hypothetical protein
MERGTDSVRFLNNSGMINKGSLFFMAHVSSHACEGFPVTNIHNSGKKSKKQMQ